jgi:hypothetical protein
MAFRRKGTFIDRQIEKEHPPSDRKAVARPHAIAQVEKAGPKEVG